MKKAQGQLRNLKRPGWNICYCIISKRVATRVLPQSRKGSFAVTMMKLDLMASVMTGSGKTVSVLQQIKTEKMSSNIMCHFLSVVFCHLNATVSLSSLAALRCLWLADGLVGGAPASWMGIFTGSHLRTGGHALPSTFSSLEYFCVIVRGTLWVYFYVFFSPRFDILFMLCTYANWFSKPFALATTFVSSLEKPYDF